MSPTRLLRQLKALATAAYDNLYERLELVSQLLDNTQWMQTHVSPAAAIQTLQEEYFRDIGGFISLTKMLDIFKTFSRKQWEMYHFDLRAMQLIYDQPRNLTPATPADAEAGKRRLREMTQHFEWEDPNETPAELLLRLQQRRDRLALELKQLDARIKLARQKRRAA